MKFRRTRNPERVTDLYNLIPFRNTYSEWLIGEMVKRVRCKQCGHKYAYLMQAYAQGTVQRFILSAEGDESSGRAAELNARAKLYKKLRHGCDVVPCPECGLIQPKMISVARRRYLRPLIPLGTIVVSLACCLALAKWVNDTSEMPFAVLEDMSWLFVGAFVGAGLGMILLKGALARAHDPNATDVGTRKQLSQSRCLSPEEIEAIEAEPPGERVGPDIEEPVPPRDSIGNIMQALDQPDSDS